jgi:hypothetical protein
MKKGFTAEQIIGKLRGAEILLSQGSTEGEVSRKLGVTEQTYFVGGGSMEGCGQIEPEGSRGWWRI